METPGAAPAVASIARGLRKLARHRSDGAAIGLLDSDLCRLSPPDAQP